MCLLTKQLLPRRATKPITVYKLVVADMEAGKYYTPYQNVEVEAELNGRIVAKGPVLGKYRIGRIYPGYINSEIGKGYIHAFIHIESAKNMISIYTIGFKILECIIEPGTLYYKNSNEICARSLTVKGVIY